MNKVESYCETQSEAKYGPAHEKGRFIGKELNPTDQKVQSEFEKNLKADHQKQTELIVKRVKKMLIGELKMGMADRLLSLEQKALIKRIEEIDFKLANSNSELCSGHISPRATVGDQLMICPSLLLAPTVTQLSILAHELAHAVDPCDVKVEYIEDKKTKGKLQQVRMPFYEYHHHLFDRYHHIQQKWAKENVEMVNGSSKIKEMIADQCSSITAEAFADSLSAKITNQYVQDENISSQEFQDGMSFWLERKCVDNGIRIYPSPEERLGMFLSYPRLEKLMGCKNSNRVPTLEQSQNKSRMNLMRTKGIK